MAGKLKEINSSVLTGAVSSVKLTGIDTDNVYKLVMTNITPSTINADVILRLTEGGTASADSDYDESAKQPRSDTTFSDLADTNRDMFVLSGSLNNTVGTGFNGVVNIFNANNSGLYTYVTIETCYMAEDGSTFLGIQGGGVYTQTTAVDGIEITLEGPVSNIASGSIALYEVLV